MTTHWDVAALAGIAGQRDATLPLLPTDAVAPIVPDLVFWDMWPLAHPDGATVIERGRALWFFLAAPRADDHDERHHHARIHLLTRGADGWHHHGPALPDGWSPGAREWSGSAVLGEGGTVTLHFTAAGRRGATPGYDQRLFAGDARLRWRGDAPVLDRWTPPVETARADGRWYRPAAQDALTATGLKGFRDPGLFRDPADGSDWLVFTGSAGWVDQPFDGVVGLARRDGARWTMQPPLVEAIGVAAELERPHLIARDGRYYLFWSTPAHRFAPGIGAPTGLYGVTAPALAGPWSPVNATGLVAANPPAGPAQAYCWWVTGELDVLSFVDLPDADGGPRFIGAPAPFFRLSLDGDSVTVAQAASDVPDR